jgi:hypothetical protein
MTSWFRSHEKCKAVRERNVSRALSGHVLGVGTVGGYYLPHSVNTTQLLPLDSLSILSPSLLPDTLHF